MEMKRIFLSVLIIAFSGLLGCTAPVKHSDPAQSKNKATKSSSPSSQVKKNSKAKAKKPLAKRKSTKPPVSPSASSESIDPNLLYQLMSAEIAGQRGQMGVAVKNYLAAAEMSQDASIAERATRIAVYARDDKSTLRAARVWVKMQPDNLEVHQVLAALLVRQGKVEQAQVHLEKLVEAKGNSKNSFMLIGALLSKEKDKQAALKTMRKLVTKYSDNPSALYALSHLAYLVGSFDTAEENIIKTLNLKPDWSEANILYANILGRLGENEMVTVKLESVLQKQSEDKKVRLFLARKYIDLKKFDKAINHFQYLLEQEPNHVDALYALGLLSMELKKTDEAEHYFLRLLELKQRENEARYYLGQVAEKNKKSEDARRWYGKVEEGNYFLEANIRIANIIAREGDVLGGREHLQNIAADTSEMELQLYLAEGELLREAKQYQEAIQLYSNGLERLKDNISLLYARALTAEKVDNIHQTILDLTHITELEPSNVEALNALGYTLIDQTERVEEGFKYIRKAYAMNPDSAAIMDSMGWGYYRTGKHDEALKYLRMAFDKMKDSEIAAHLGEVLWVSGEEQEARKIWVDALREKPEDKTLLKVIERFSE